MCSVELTFIDGVWFQKLKSGSVCFYRLASSDTVKMWKKKWQTFKIKIPSLDLLSDETRKFREEKVERLSDLLEMTKEFDFQLSKTGGFTLSFVKDLKRFLKKSLERCMIDGGVRSKGII